MNAPTAPTPLDSTQVEAYRSNGFLVVEDLLTPEEVEAFVRYEAEAQANQTGPRGLQNHKADDKWAHITHHPRIAAIVRQLNGEALRIVQTMYMNKSPEGSTGVALHQDTHYIRNEPNSLMACWLAFSDTDADNGGLCIVPGSNNTGLREFDRVKDTDEHTSWEQVYAMSDREGKCWDETMHSFDIKGLAEEEIVRLDVPSGSGVFFTGMTIHGSFANHSSDSPRRAFAIHYIQEGTWIYRSDLQETVPLR
jgi:ectoine hydroxylase-related dioxygenase (phytanoyl-CoA dioxygenase family)